MGRTVIILSLSAILIVAGIGVYALLSGNNGDNSSDDGPTKPDVENMDLIMTVDGKKVDVLWEDNPSVKAIKELAYDGLTIDMKEYGNFEQTGSMPSSVVKDDSWIEVGAGDIVLYRGVQICLYFNDNAYDFTRLGKISNMADSEIKDMLDKDSVKVVLTLSKK